MHGLLEGAFRSRCMGCVAEKVGEKGFLAFRGWVEGKRFSRERAAYGSVMLETRTAAQEVGEGGGGIHCPWPNTAFA